MCSCIKYTVAFFEMIITLAGVGLIILGTYAFIGDNTYDLIVPESMFEISISIIVIGILVVLIGLAGIFGACTESACTLYTIGTILFLIFAAEIGGAVAGYVLRDEIVDSFNDKMNETIYKFEMNDTEVQKEMNDLQQKLECCGIESYKDWSTVYGVVAVPLSCCKKTAENCISYPVDEDKIYKEGCLERMKDVFWPYIIGVGATLAAVIIIQIVTIVFACCFATSVLNNNKK